MTNLYIRLPDIDAFVTEKLSNITDQRYIIANKEDPFYLRMIFVKIATPLDEHKGLSAPGWAFDDLVPPTQLKGQSCLGFVEPPDITPVSIFTLPLPERKLNSCGGLQDAC